jgi:hypothetical protein
VSSPAQAQADLDRWSVAVSDRRQPGQRTVAELAGSEPLLSLPELPFEAEFREQRVVSRDALASFENNRYSVAPGHGGDTVEVRARLGELHVEIYTPTGRRIARHLARSRVLGRRSAPTSTPARSSRPCSTVHLQQAVSAQAEPAARRAGAG